MPTYEYACTRCGTHVEVFQRFGDEPLRECGLCGGDLRKVFHPAGIVFKGSGFYATDSRTSPKEPSGGEGKPKGKPDGGKGETGKGQGGKEAGQKPEGKSATAKPEGAAPSRGSQEKSA